MDYFQDFIAALSNFIKKDNLKIDVPMKNHTSFKVGGPVDVLVMPEKYEEINRIIELCEKYDVNYYIIGNGSNLLVRDGGLRGVAIKLLKLNKLQIGNNKIIAGCGVPLGYLSRKARDKSLTGLEFACGIPGSVGGAVAMNAGAYNGEISNVVESVLVIDNKGKMKRLYRDELQFGYRSSAILKHKYIALEVTFTLQKGDREKIANRIDDLMRRRIEKQPLEYPSAGSTFKRPVGHFAAKLIEDSGLKGKGIGGDRKSVV